MWVSEAEEAKLGLPKVEGSNKQEIVFRGDAGGEKKAGAGKAEVKVDPRKGRGVKMHLLRRL